MFSINAGITEVAEVMERAVAGPPEAACVGRTHVRFRPSPVLEFLCRACAAAAWRELVLRPRIIGQGRRQNGLPSFVPRSSCYGAGAGMLA